MSAIVIGNPGRCSLFLGLHGLQSKFGYDDSLDAFGIHGVGGTLGAFLTGVFATKLINPMQPTGSYTAIRDSC